jgi:hypothetical protein
MYGTIRIYASLIENHGVEVHVSYEIEELAEILGATTTVLATNPVTVKDDRKLLFRKQDKMTAKSRR